MSRSSASAMATSRSAASAPGGTSTSPQSVIAGPSVETINSAYPIPVVPGSMPRMVRGASPPENPPRLELRVLEPFFGHVEVRVHLLYVVEVLEGVDEADELAGGVALDADRRRRPHGELRRGGMDPGGLQRALHSLEGRWCRVDGDEARLGLDVLGARVDRGQLDGVGGLALGVDLDDALLFEEPLHRPRFSQLAT